MRMRRIHGIKGSFSPGYEPIPALDGILAGYIWHVGPYGEIIDFDNDIHRVLLEVEGYPETRGPDERGDEVVRITMRRQGGIGALYQVVVPLLQLAQRPFLAASEWEEMPAESENDDQ